MIPEERDVERLTDAQVSDLLEMALTTELGVEMERLSSLPSESLVQEVRAVLEQNDLGLRESARLLSVNELTLKSWLDASKTLPEPAQQKLAAICVLLKAATAPGADEEIASLVRTAVALAKGPLAQQTPIDENRLGAIAASFGPSGLMSAALYLALPQ
jgi:hypothetical protein